MTDSIATAPPSRALEEVRGVTASDGTTKARIERAAVTLFVTRGVDAATTREIATVAGVAEGTLYRHFKGKDELAESAFFSVHHRLADLVDEAGAIGADVNAQARAIVEALVAFADEDWTLFQFHLLYTHHFLPRRHEAKNPVAATEGLIITAMERGEIRPTNDPASRAMILAAMVLGVVQQTALHKAYGRITGDLSDLKDTLSAAVIAVLHSSETDEEKPHVS